MASIFNFPLQSTVDNGGFGPGKSSPSCIIDGQVEPFVETSIDSIDAEMSTFANAQDTATGSADYAAQATAYDAAGICSANDAIVVEFVRRKNQGSR